MFMHSQEDSDSINGILIFTHAASINTIWYFSALPKKKTKLTLNNHPTAAQKSVPAGLIFLNSLTEVMDKAIRIILQLFFHMTIAS